MRTNKKAKQTSLRRPEVRSLKIQPRVRENTYSSKDVPEIRLCGEWLNKLGFAHGRRVAVTTMDKLLIIRLQQEELLGQLAFLFICRLGKAPPRITQTSISVIVKLACGVKNQ